MEACRPYKTDDRTWKYRTKQEFRFSAKVGGVTGDSGASTMITLVSGGSFGVATASAVLFSYFMF